MKGEVVVSAEVLDVEYEEKPVKADSRVSAWSAKRAELPPSGVGRLAGGANPTMMRGSALDVLIAKCLLITGC